MSPPILESVRSADDPGDPNDLLERAARSAGRGLLSGRHTTVRPRHVTHFEREVLIARPCEDVFDFCLHAENVKAVLPDRIEPVAGTPLVGEAGGVYEFNYWIRSRVPVLWVVFIDGFVQGRQFIDHQLRGPFRWYRHTHGFRASEGGMYYRDSIEFATRFGRAVDRMLVARDLDGVFAHRHRRMRELLER